MNFTREPIIETVITPKDGYKLTIRNTKGGSQEEYSVDAIEVVSFGQSMFFRSLERPKSFLLPVTDYEVVEVKETRVVLKNAPLEGSIKIAGGKVTKPAMTPTKEHEEKAQPVANKSSDEGFDERPSRRRKTSMRRRRQEQEANENSNKQLADNKASKGLIAPPILEGEKKLEADAEVSPLQLEAPISTSMFRGLIPPPPGLISEKLQHEKYSPYMKDAKEEKVQSVEEGQEDNSLESPQEYAIVVDNDIEETPVSAPISDEVIEKEPLSQQPRYHAAPRNDQGDVSF